MNLSTWDNIKIGRRKNPALAPAHVVVEFDRTKTPKVLAHKLANVDFNSAKDINPLRNSLIDKELQNVTTDGYRYKSVGHVYQANTLIPANTNTDSYSYSIYAHGSPIGGKNQENARMENCAKSGLICGGGEGTDTICNPGKCIIGNLTRERRKKWRYESVNIYGSNDLPVVYFVSGVEKVALKTILRGNVESFSDNGPAVLPVDRPASISATIYLPPNLYFSEDFISQIFLRIDERLRDVVNPPKSPLVGAEDRKTLFINKFITYLYEGKSEGYLNNVLYDVVLEEHRDGLIDVLSTITNEWATICSEYITLTFAGAKTAGSDTIKFLSDSYDILCTLFNSTIQVSKSSFKYAKIDYDKDRIARPVYSRLPGLAEAYRLDPAFSDNTPTPAQWITSGADEFLSVKKDQIAEFYYDYLDPDSCSPVTLDWLAQHAGLIGNLWDERWDRKIKTSLINNAFGWWDRASTLDLPKLGEVKTPKGEVLSKFPFTDTSFWTDTSTDANNLSIDFGEIETIVYNPETKEITGYEAYKQRVYNPETSLVSRAFTTHVVFDKNLWNGLFEAKGSLLASAFLCSLFGLKAHTPYELEIVDVTSKVLRPRSGLRATEANAPTLVPHYSTVIQVGTELDAEVGNYTNQLIAGISRVASIEQSKNVFFRMPFYYNRDGKSWDRATYIANNWLPSNLNVKVQYAYPSADLLGVGDGFFEIDLKEE